MLLLVLLGVIFLILAGLNVRTPRFAPEWFGFACIALALFYTPLTAAF